ncbi:MAG: phosphotransferase [Microthrixaceae bacterium]
MDPELSGQLASAGLAAADRVVPLVFNPNNACTRSVERVELEDGSTVVRKVLRRSGPTPVAHWSAGAHPSHWNHWRREADAYESGAVRCLEPFLEAPRLLARFGGDAPTEVLLLEHVAGRSACELTIADLASVALALGRAQGCRDAAPPRSFTSGSLEWIWAYATSRPPGPRGYLDEARWSHPVVTSGFADRTATLRRGYGELMAQLPRWRRVLAAAPVATCHLDLWSRNLVLADDEQGSGPGRAPVLLDWSFVGRGAVGQDPGHLVCAELLEHHFDPGLCGELDRAVWQGYSSGLEDSGWPHDPRWARLAMCVAALGFVWLPAAMVDSADHEGPTGYAGGPGHDLVEVFDRRGRVLAWMLERMDEARELAAQLGLDAPCGPASLS